jgi:hypothetical protein
MTMHAPTPERVGSSASGSSAAQQRMPDMDALYSRLAEADECGDAKALAALAWELYGLLGLDEGDLNSLRTRVHQLLAPGSGPRGLGAPGHWAAARAAAACRGATGILPRSPLPAHSGADLPVAGRSAGYLLADDNRSDAYPGTQ